MWVDACGDACSEKGQRGALRPKPLTCGVFDLVGFARRDHLEEAVRTGGAYHEPRLK